MRDARSKYKVQLKKLIILFDFFLRVHFAMMDPKF